jgi:hypothetical protein
MVDVVNLKRCKDWGKPGDVYIGRKFGKFPASKWGNPFRMNTESERDLVCYKYEEWVNTEILTCRLNIDELLTAKRLGCFCKPLRCHGDYLKTLIENRLKEHEKSM